MSATIIQKRISEIQTELGVHADGVWGPKTNEAYLKWRALRRTGKKTPAATVPKDTPAGLRAFYGNPGDSLVRLKVPYEMVLSWDTTAKIKSFVCHEKVHDTLLRCLQKIANLYGSQKKIEDARMHLFGGCYNDRNRRGGRTLSTHAWGAAIDLDPVKNARGKPYQAGAGMMPTAVVKIFEDEGWVWGGRFSTPDAMHFQYAKI
jgi:hypothetical protein